MGSRKGSGVGGGFKLEAVKAITPNAPDVRHRRGSWVAFFYGNAFKKTNHN